MIHQQFFQSNSLQNAASVRSQRNPSNLHRALIDIKRKSIVITRWNDRDESDARIFEWNGTSSLWDGSAEAREWFDSILKTEELKGYEVAISLPQSLVSLHLLTLPNLSDKQLSEVIPIQLESIYNDKHNEVTHDVIRIRDHRDEHATVIVATAPKKLVQWLKNLCSEHKIHISQLSCIEIALPMDRSVQQEELHDAVYPVIVAQQDCIHIALAHGSHILHYQSIANDPCASQHNKLLGRIRLLEAALPENLQSLPRQKGLLIVNSDCDFKAYSTLASQLELEPVEVDLAKSFAFSHPSNETRRIDFSRPWKPSNPNRHLPLISLAVCVSFCILAGVLVFRHVQLTRLKRELHSIEAALTKLRTEIEHEAPHADQWERIQSWKDSSVSWGSELVAIASQSARTDNAYLHRLQLEATESELRPLIRFDGRARSVSDAIAWNHFEEPIKTRYAIVPQSFETTLTDPEFPIHFRSEASLLQLTTKDDE